MLPESNRVRRRVRVRLCVVSLIVFAIAGAFADLAHAAPLPPITVHANQTYAVRGQLPLMGDVYASQKARLRPAVLIVHGGGWNNGSRADERVRALKFARAGFSVFSIDYRLSCRHGETIRRANADPNERATYPLTSPRRYQYCAGANMFDMQADVSDALRFMNDHRFVFRMNMARVTVFGASAGGHLALQAAQAQPEGVPAVRTSIAWSGPSELLRTRSDGSRVLRAIEIALGCADRDCPSIWRRASPQYMLKQQIRARVIAAPRTLLVASKVDPTVSWRDTFSMFRTMRSLNAPTTMYTVPRACHGANCNSYVPAGQRDTVINLTLAWLTQVQRP